MTTRPLDADPRVRAAPDSPRTAPPHPHLRPRWWRATATVLAGLSLGAAVHAAAMPPAQASESAAARSQHIADGETPSGVAAPEWRSVRQQISAHQHRFVPQPDGSVHADSPAQGWQARFDGSGQVQVQGGQPAKPWQMRLKLQGVGYGPSLSAPGQQPVMSVQGETLHYRWSEHLTEWWTNGAQGMEQWFRLAQAPSARTGDTPLTLKLQLQGDYQAQGAGDQLVLAPRNAKAGLPTLRYHKLKAWDAQGRDVPGQMKAEAGHIVLALDDRHAQYPITIDPVLTQQAYVKASDTAQGNLLGRSVAISGDTMVVGALGQLNGSGAAYVFTRSGTTWSQQAYLKASNPDDGDTFGLSVGISGDTIVVGAESEASAAPGVNPGGSAQSNNDAVKAGAAYVFARSGTTWSQQAYLKASNPDAFDNFGYSVAISGNTVVVGAPGEDSAASGVNPGGGAQSDDTVNSAGAAYVFTRNGAVWSQQAYLKASSPGPEDTFGLSIAIDDNTVVVGAPNVRVSGPPAGQAGAIYVFTRSGTNWSEQAFLRSSNIGRGDRFGVAVAVSGDTLVAGAYFESGSATGVNGPDNNDALQAGAAYVFTRSSNTWTQQAYLKASNTGSADNFGGSVGISDNMVVVGATREDGNSGAAYTFIRSGTTWSEQDYLKASNVGASDWFGFSVAVSGQTVVVGAPYEASNATGVDSDQFNNLAPNAGAAYVFGSTAAAAFTLTGTPGPAVVGSPYGFTPTLDPASVTPAVTYSVSAGALPPGLLLNPATGAFTGTPTDAGSFPLTLTATNVDGSADLPITIVVSAAAGVAPTLAGAPGPAVVGTGYAFAPTLGPVGVTQPVTFSVAPNTLPPGLALNPATGAITGTPTTQGSYPLTLHVANAAGTADLPVTIVVAPAGGGVAGAPVLSGAPTQPVVGSPYSFVPTLAPGATQPVAFTLTSGTLPPGLVLNPVTGAITGTPTVPGSYPVTLRASNADGEADLVITLAVSLAAVPVPTLGQWALMALGLLAAGLGARRLRVR